MRKKEEKHAARLNIVDAVVTDFSNRDRWVVEALIELAVTIDEAAEKITNSTIAVEVLQP